ncbi:MAG: NUDIX domain-containing protein [Roseinatronobacter sp.]
MTKPRVAVRAVILHQNRLLMVNAWPDGQSDLWCAPGGGVEAGKSLPENLKREVFEECGLQIAVGSPCLVNEFHDPSSQFHQIDIYFRAEIIAGRITDAWRDPEGIVTRRRLVSASEMRSLRFKPDTLPEIAWGDAAWDGRALYDPLEPILR